MTATVPQAATVGAKGAKPPTSPLSRGRSNKKLESNLFAIVPQRRRKDNFDSMFTSLVFKYGGSVQVSESTEE